MSAVGQLVRVERVTTRKGVASSHVWVGRLERVGSTGHVLLDSGWLWVGDWTAPDGSTISTTWAVAGASIGSAAVAGLALALAAAGVRV